ncbi:MAG: LUD domain-containing protein [Bryobacteraceae bacterium]|nr:LUD domain-containing protein [Bryobacteraceae bacterium]
MTAREEILGKVRGAVGRIDQQAPARAPAVRIRIPEIGLEDRVTMFRERLEALGGKVYRAGSLAEAGAVVQQIRPQGRAVASNSALLREAGVTSLPDVVTDFHDEPALCEACAEAACGITAADYGMAQTGSLVTRASSEARLVSLLPPIHIALLMKDRLLTGLDEFYTLVPQPAGDTCSTVFITGPSRSADIEMILVRGVHGPKAIHVIVVER